jgi:eukaryotic-like serine/threonine-protein kinase
MTGLRRVVHEIHRRSLWQVMGVYLAASWVALQVVHQIAESLALPPWVDPFTVILLVLGFPIVLATAFVQEGVGGPVSGGSDARDDSDAPGPAATAPSRPAVGPPPGGTAPERAGSAPRWLFTWRNALVGGALAFLLLAAATWGFMTMRSRGIGPIGSLVAKGLLDERSPLLLADIDAADLGLANAATEALRVDLSQSRIVRLVEPARVTEALRRMERPADARLDEALALELAVREGIPAVVAGDLDAVGRGFSLTARILRPADGAVLASARAAARDSTQVLEAIDALSRQLRERVGESYGSLRSDPPLESVTTSSLAALRKYTEAVRLGREGGSEEASIALLEEAVALDTTFASAWRTLAIALGNRFQEPSRQIDALEKAYRHRKRLTERERYFVEATYYRTVTDEQDRAIQAFEAMLRLDPTDLPAINNIGVIHYWRGEHEKALAYYRHAAAIDTTRALPAANVAVTLANIGDYGGADSAFEATARRPGFERFRWWSAVFPSSRGDYAEATRRLLALEQAGRSGPAEVELIGSALAALEALHGRLASAESHWRASEEAARGVSDDHFLQRRVERAMIHLVAAGDRDRALALVEGALAEAPLDSLPSADWPDRIVAFFANAGDPDRAEALLEERIRRTDPRLRPVEERRRHSDRGTIALARGEPALALEEFRRQPPGDCRPCAALGPALAFDAMGVADSAIVHYEEYLARPYNWRIFPDAAWRAHVLERLGDLYDERGDLEQAAGWYAQLVELWADADPALQPRVRAARKRLEAIHAERG